MNRNEESSLSCITSVPSISCHEGQSSSHPSHVTASGPGTESPWTRDWQHWLPLPWHWDAGAGTGSRPGGPKMGQSSSLRVRLHWHPSFKFARTVRRQRMPERLSTIVISANLKEATPNSGLQENFGTSHVKSQSTGT